MRDLIEDSGLNQRFVALMSSSDSNHETVAQRVLFIDVRAGGGGGGGVSDTQTFRIDTRFTKVKMQLRYRLNTDSFVP